MKTCPYCAESIQDEAIKCRFCKERLDVPFHREPHRPLPGQPARPPLAPAPAPKPAEVPQCPECSQRLKYSKKRSKYVCLTCNIVVPPCARCGRPPKLDERTDELVCQRCGERQAAPAAAPEPAPEKPRLEVIEEPSAPEPDKPRLEVIKEPPEPEKPRLDLMKELAVPQPEPEKPRLEVIDEPQPAADAPVPLTQRKGGLSRNKLIAIIGGGLAALVALSIIFIVASGDDKPTPKKPEKQAEAPRARPMARVMEAARERERPTPVAAMRAAPRPRPVAPPAPRPTGRWIPVPGGCFTQGATDGNADEGPPHKVCVSPFRMDRTEVTVKQYRECTRAGRCSAPESHRPDDDQKWQWFCNWDAPGREGHPVNCVKWKQAMAYCKWVGGRLPTESEWEYAARGREGRKYPWGSTTPNCGVTVMHDSQGHGCGAGHTRPVGTRPKGASPFGLLDLSGNVWELLYDCYDKHFYGECDPPCQDPVNLRCGRRGASGIRGASYGNSLKTVGDFRATYRGSWKRRGKGPRIGFRCVIPGPRSTQPVATQAMAVARVTASSTLKPFKKHTFDAGNATDGQLHTSWQPKGGSAAVGQWLRIRFKQKVRITSVRIANGYQRVDGSTDQFENNGRLKRALLEFSDGSKQRLTLSAARRGFVKITTTPVVTRWVKLTIEEIQAGAKYKDMAISEIQFIGRPVK